MLEIAPNSIPTQIATVPCDRSDTNLCRIFDSTKRCFQKRLDPDSRYLC